VECPPGREEALREIAKRAEAGRTVCKEPQEWTTLPPAEQKRRLVVTEKRGEFVKDFPRNACLVQEPEKQLVHAINCPADCQYCFLQSYYEHSVPTVYVNHEEMFVEIERTISEAAGRSVTFHAGEMSDALIFDGITGLAAKLVALFRKHPNARLELRTKTACIDGLLSVPPATNVIPAWTMNPECVVAEYEKGTANLDERIQAARRCQKHGYGVGLRFDPLIHIDGWEDAYAGLVKQVFAKLDPGRIESCVIGALRLQQRLKEIIEERFPDSRLTLDEFVQCADGKLRYFRPMRVEMYRKMIGWLKGVDAKLPVELCMETPEVHRDLAVLLP
jgi:spore photoproduct lyase